MRHQFTLEWWQDGDQLVGRLLEVPNVCSQGASLAELAANIQDAYSQLMPFTREPAPPAAQRQPLELEV